MSATSPPIARPPLSGGQIPRAGLAVVLVLAAWTFLPIRHLPTFDSQKSLVLVVGAAILTLIAALRRAPARDRDLLVAVPLALVTVALGVTLAAGPRGSLAGPLLALGAMGIGRLAAADDDAKSLVLCIARGAACAAAGAGIYALVQRAGLDPAPWGDRRAVVGTFGNTSFAASFQAAALPLAAYLAIARSGRDRVLGVLAVAVAVPHLIMAASRIDLVAAAAATPIAVAVVLRGHRRRGAAWAVIGVGAVAALIAAALFVATAAGKGPAFLGRADTLAVRTHVWGAFADLIVDVPLWLPQGAAFVDLFPNARHPDEFVLSFGRTVETPHADLLGLIVVLGVALTGVAVVAAAALARRLWSGGGEGIAERAAVFAALTALFVSSLASSPLTHGATAALAALLWGAAVALRPTGSGRGETRAAHGLAVVVLALATFPVLAMLRSDAFLASGRQALEDGHPADALRHLDVAAQADGRAFEPRAELGGLLLNARETDAAIASLRAALTIRPNSPVARSNLARALLVGGDAAAAADVLAAALADTPWHPELRATEGHIALAEGRGADAVRAFEAAARYLGHEPRIEALLAEARLTATPGGAAHEGAIAVLRDLLEAGDDVQVQRSTAAMLRRDPTLLPALVATARRLVEDAPEHAAALVMAMAAHPAAQEDTGFLIESARVLTQAGRTQDAARFTGHALGLRGREALARGENELALRLTKKAVARDPDPDTWLVMARALARLDQNTAAVEAIGSAVASGHVDVALVRTDPDLEPLCSDPRLELILKRAAQRAGEVP